MAIKVTFLIRRDTAGNWASVNPTLGLGEPALETDTKRIKYGDGSTPWDSLGYASVPLPTGGAAGAILQKYGAGDYEFTWSPLTAGIVPFTPVGTLSATDVQGALAELAGEKVQGPGASVDNAVVRWDGTGGFQVQSSNVTIDDSDNIATPGTMSVADEAYGTGWNGSTQVPTKNAVYDKIESMGGGGVTTFIALTDVPSSYTGHALEFTRVKSDGSGLEFAPVLQLPAGGAAGTILQKFGAGDGEATWSSLTAGITSFTPAGGLSSTDVQSALVELDTEKQAANARLTALSGVASGTDTLPYFTGATTMAVTALSAFGRSLIDDASNTAARTTLGLGTAAIRNTGTSGTNVIPVLSGANTWSANQAFTTITVTDDAYGAGWNGSTQVPTKNAVYDKIEAILAAPADQIPTLNGGWINYGGGFGGARYKKDANGLVTIEGLIQAAGGTSTTLVLFTLLAGYRPADTLMFVCWSGGGAYRVDVAANGDVTMQGGNTAFSSLSGIQFYAA